MKLRTIYLAVIFTASVLFAQDTARVMTYNLLNYPETRSFSRQPLFKMIVETVNPDILVVQEITSSSGVTQFLTNVLNDDYKAGQFYDGPDTDNALFYKDSLFEFIGNLRITTSLRDINQFTVRHKLAGDTLLIYSVHLKASQGSTNEDRRFSEATRLRSVTDQLGENKYFMVLGDFNIYTDDEPAFQKLIDQGNGGYFVDPINAYITWHNNSAARSLHTQSTRTDNLGDGGSTGGLDDRFDMILISQSVDDPGGITYIGGTYTPFGNDGNHFNDAINLMPNNAVSQEIADALHEASDHLPVYADFEFEPITSVKVEEEVVDDFQLYQNYPNPFNPTTTIKFTIPAIKSPLHWRGFRPARQSGQGGGGFLTLKIYDILGTEIATLVNETKLPGKYEVEFDASNLASGVYFYTLSTDRVILSKKMILLR